MVARGELTLLSSCELGEVLALCLVYEGGCAPCDRMPRPCALALCQVLDAAGGHAGKEVRHGQRWLVGKGIGAQQDALALVQALLA